MTQIELEKAIKLALKQAYIANEKEEIPVGCCIITPLKDGKFDYTSAYNHVEADGDPFKHAEVLAINKLIKKYDKKHFLDSVLVVTLEPCPICYYAIRKVGIKEIYYLLSNPDDGAFSKDYAQDRNINSHYIFNEEYKKLFDEFFVKYKIDKKAEKEKKKRETIKRPRWER